MVDVPHNHMPTTPWMVKITEYPELHACDLKKISKQCNLAFLSHPLKNMYVSITAYPFFDKESYSVVSYAET